MLKQILTACVGMAIVCSTSIAEGPQIISISTAETCGAFSGVRPSIDIDSAGQPHIVVDSGHAALGSTMMMYNRIGGSWRSSLFANSSSEPSVPVTPSAISQPWIEIDASDRMWVFAQYFRAGSMSASGQGVWLYQYMTSSPTKTWFAKKQYGAHGWGPGNLSIDPAYPNEAVVMTINGAYGIVNSEGTTTQTGTMGPNLSGEKFRFRIAPYANGSQRGVWHGIMNGSSVRHSSYRNSLMSGDVVWASHSPYYPSQGDDHNHAGVCGDLENPEIGYMAAVFEDGGTHNGLQFNVWRGESLRFAYTSQQLGILDSEATFIHRYAPAMTPAHGGGCWIAWGNEHGEIWMAHIDKDGNVGSKEHITDGFTCAINTDTDGNVHMAYNVSGTVRYIKIMVSGSGASSFTRPIDLDGDGAADLGIYDNATGNWWIKQATRSGNGTVLAAGSNWGFPGVVPVPGNYHGETNSPDEIAVFNSRDANWYTRSHEADVTPQNWGSPGFTPVPNDYDGDGMTDLAVFDGELAEWWIWSFTKGNILIDNNQWGYPGVIPVPADYDGDGICDLGVYDPHTYRWYIRGVEGSIIAWDFWWGYGGTIPVPLNYDDDPEFEMGAFDPSSGNWHITDVNQSRKWFSVNWGFSGVVPAPANYDGDADNTWELGVFNPANGNWYIRGMNNVTPDNWGWNSSSVIPMGSH